MASRPKQAEPRPAPRLYLITPPVTDASRFAGELTAALGAADIAAVLGRLADGDIIKLDSYAGTLEARIPDDALRQRAAAKPDLSRNGAGIGRELFGGMRRNVLSAEEGAVTWL